MCGMVHALIIPHATLKNHLLPFVYLCENITLGLWRHITNGIIFNLVVDDFERK